MLHGFLHGFQGVVGCGHGAFEYGYSGLGTGRCVLGGGINQAAEVQKKISGLVVAAAKNAPAGSETAVAIFKSAVSAANNALESVQKAVKQATDVAEANFNNAASTAMNATKAVAKKR